jgi:hypothetical protein
MAWVKRNLVFVIIVAVGLIATGYCGYLLYSAHSADKAISDDYNSTVDQLNTLAKSTPPITKENIEAAAAEQTRVKDFLGDFKKAFQPFPTPPKVDDQGFVTHLNLYLRQFGSEATNAGVLLPPDYSFSFSQQKEKVSFMPECIAPWMQELEEIKALLHIVFEAKINYLELLQRPSVCQDDTYGTDVLPVTSSSNAWGTVTPYKLTFRCFSQEIANVLAGFADSSNCFIVKYVNVQQSKEPLPNILPPTAPTAPQPRYMQRPAYNPDFNMERGNRERPYFQRPQPQLAPQEAPAGPAPPETILQETPLYVTLVVDAVKLKPPEPKAPAAAAKPTLRAR